ncbi:hypothetical protein J3458_011781 [Metarhizium acridum]|uniref:uncharacterized protein n=1 Tax=Metarhizium acridum TaxID=92637 RepID=UPI001C6B38AE|nr:hypothetical protein J3458_011781 [Metarhizium acridum]
MSLDNENRVPGHNTAVYAIAPSIRCEAAPDVIETDRATFVYVVGHLPESEEDRARSP